MGLFDFLNPGKWREERRKEQPAMVAQHADTTGMGMASAAVQAR